MTHEYWRWPESSWTSADIDWKKCKNITAGVDVGTNSTQAAVLCDDKLFGYSSLRTGPDYRVAAEKAMTQALGKSSMKLKDIKYIVATGWGSRNVPFAGKTIDLYGWDRVRDFQMNDKCADGFGRSIEVMADLLQVPLGEMGERSLVVEKDPEPVSTTCYAFANTEAIGLFREGYTEAQVLAAYLFAIAWRLHGTIGRVQPEKEIAFTGGLAKNPGIVKRIEREMKMNGLKSDYDPMLAGAIGAAIIARETS